MRTRLPVCHPEAAGTESLSLQSKPRTAKHTDCNCKVTFDFASLLSVQALRRRRGSG